MIMNMKTVSNAQQDVEVNAGTLGEYEVSIDNRTEILPVDPDVPITDSDIGSSEQEDVETIDAVVPDEESEQESTSLEMTPMDPPSYSIGPGGILSHKPGSRHQRQLTNFWARIECDIFTHDGVEVQHMIELSAGLGSRTVKFDVDGATLSSMAWPIEHIGAGAIIYPGCATEAKIAIQQTSGDIPERRIYSHTGWSEIDGRWIYLHAGGGIDKDGVVPDVTVNLPGNLSDYSLPPVSNEETLRRAVRKSMEMIDVVPADIGVPTYAYIWRTILGGVDVALHLAGPTGARKTAYAALAQQHWGSALNAANLPGSWTSTDNALEGTCFVLKDAILTIDDFNPIGNKSDVHRYNNKADRVIRGLANHSGRARMSRDAKVKPPKPPRCGLLSTGEDIPTGHSLRGRMLIMEMDHTSVDLSSLTDCQADAESGQYAIAMNGFISWVAGNYDRIQSELSEKVNDLRDSLSGAHSRMPTTAANLIVGLCYFLEFTQEIGIHTEVEAEEMDKKWTEAILKSVEDQGQYLVTEKPEQQFVELLAAAISSGKAHVCDRSGSFPPNPEGWGWEQRSGTWYSRGDRVAWVDGDDIYLQPASALQAARSMATSGSELTKSIGTIKKRMDEQGLLKSTDKDGRGLTIRVMVSGNRTSVLHLDTSSVMERVDEGETNPRYIFPDREEIVEPRESDAGEATEEEWIGS